MNAVRHWIVGWVGSLPGCIVKPRFLAWMGFVIGLCGLVYRVRYFSENVCVAQPSDMVVLVLFLFDGVSVVMHFGV